MQSPSKPVIVVAPPSAESKIDPGDSTYLRINFMTKEYKISLLNDSLTTKDINRVDSFITDKERHINKDKIIVTRNQNSDFKALSEILKKHKYFKFRMTTDGE